MHKKGLVVAVLLGLTVSTAAAILLTRKMSEQYIDRSAGTNQGFETHRNNMPANWQLYTSRTTGTGKFTVATDNNTFHSGTRSLKFDVTECSAKGGRFSPGIAQEYDALPGNYQVTYWIKNNGCQARVQLSGVTATEHTSGPVADIAPETSGWTLHTLLYTLAANRNRIRFEFNVLSPGTLWIDDVQLTRMP